MKHSIPRSIRRSACLLVALAALAAPSRALAQGARPEAEQLFRDGKRLLKEGKLAEACLAFESSEKAEPNIATLLSLADCHEKAGQYASAWARFLNAESRTRGEADKTSHNQTARKRAAALEGRLSYLTINVPDESRVEGLQVTRDGLDVDPGQWNRAVPVDGGKHVISGKAPGHESWSTTVEVAAERDQRAVEVPKFKELPTLISPEPGTLARRGRLAGGGAALEAQAAAHQPSPFTPRRKVALGLAAGGVAAVGTAIGFGLAANNARSEALGLCSASACTSAEAGAAQRKNDRARSYATVANIGYGVAGGAAIAAAVLWLTSAPERPAEEEETASLRDSRPSRPRATSPATALSISPLLGAATGVAVSGGF